MCGLTPLGYDSSERTLVINDAEAKTVRTIFDLYLRLGNVRLVKEEVDRLELRTKHRPQANGMARVGAVFSRGRIYHLLSNPVYIGRIRHKDLSYEGQHDPITGPEIWEAAQTQLAAQRARGNGRSSSKTTSPLATKFTDETGDRLTASHAKKGPKKYRYYVSRRLIAQSGEPDATGWRLSAAELERAVTGALITKLSAPDFAITLLHEPTATEIDAARVATTKMVLKLQGRDVNQYLGEIIESGVISPAELSLTLDAVNIANALNLQQDRVSPDALSICTPCDLCRRGIETKLVIEGATSKVDATLLKSLAKGRAWFTEITDGASLKYVADCEGVKSTYIARMIDLAFLSPKMIDAIVAGKQPAHISTKSLIRLTIPGSWKEQHALFDLS